MSISIYILFEFGLKACKKRKRLNEDSCVTSQLQMAVAPFSFFTSFKSELKQNIYRYRHIFLYIRLRDVPLFISWSLRWPQPGRCLYWHSKGLIQEENRKTKQNKNKTTNTTPATDNINLLKLLGGEGGWVVITVWHRASVRRIHIKLMFIYHSLWLCVLYF